MRSSHSGRPVRDARAERPTRRWGSGRSARPVTVLGRGPWHASLRPYIVNNPVDNGQEVRSTPFSCNERYAGPARPNGTGVTGERGSPGTNAGNGFGPCSEGITETGPAVIRPAGDSMTP